jgi:hypothetical protein
MPLAPLSSELWEQLSRACSRCLGLWRKSHGCRSFVSCAATDRTGWARVNLSSICQCLRRSDGHHGQYWDHQANLDMGSRQAHRFGDRLWGRHEYGLRIWWGIILPYT